MELPTSPRRCLAIAMLRAVGVDQKVTAKYVRCANQTVGDVDKWLREEDYHRVAHICDDQSIKKMVAAEVIYWGLEQEIVVKLDRLTQDDILRHYRHDYHETIDFSSPSFQKHTSGVLRLLDTYAGQLAVTYEPEDFITPPEGGALPSEESALWFFAKKAVPSLETPIDRQIVSESLAIAPELERETLFVALEGHYKGTNLWKDIGMYKKVAGKYVSIGLKLNRAVNKLIDLVSAEETEAHTFRSALIQLIREDLALVRVKLNLKGIERDRTAMSSRLPDVDCTSLLQGEKLLQRYLSVERRAKVRENAKLFADLQSLLARITQVYQRLKTKQRDILRSVKEEKFKGQLPAGSKCKFCPT